MFKKIRRIHFVGIGGVGMSGIAEVLHNLGYSVSGSDSRESENTRRLTSLGVQVAIGHQAEQVGEADVVVRSSAVEPDNVELVTARQRLIPVIQRAEMLAELMRMKYGVAVAGTHGKTTTTSMVATVLARGGLDPTIVIGGRLNTLGSNAKLGRGDFLVAEADESDGSFLRLTPTIAVVTTIDAEHLDYYRDLAHIQDTFVEFINKVPFYGLAVLCLDQEHIQNLLPRVEKRFVTYGLRTQADFLAQDISFKGMTSEFQVSHKHRPLGRLQLQVPGLHNVYNALAATAVGLDLGLDFATIRDALGEFTGVARRFQILGEVSGIMVVDDYAHHPAEIQATLNAAKTGFDREVIAVFQPHRYTRTRALLREFFTAFYQADRLFVTEIYPAGERPIPGISARLIAEGVKEHGHKSVTYIPAKEDLVDAVLAVVRPGDIVLHMGAGDIWKIGEEIVRKLETGNRKSETGKAKIGSQTQTRPISSFHFPVSPSGAGVMATDALAEKLTARMRGPVLPHEPVARYTTFRIGGPADLFVVPQDVEDLQVALAFARAEGLPIYLLGGGSNTLCRDGGVRGMVILLSAFQELARQGTEVTAGVGVRLSRLLAFCSKQGLAGLEVLSGIPGTVGGAVWGNAGAWGGSAADRLARVRVVTAQGDDTILPRDAMPFGYRCSGLPPGWVIVRAVFALEPGDPVAIRRQISRHLIQRNASQPVEFRSAGCIFKNPPGDYAGRLVDVAGVKGTRIGGAMISEKHGNFILNLGGARASDVLALVSLAQAEVRARTGVDLELEIRVVGED